MPTSINLSSSKHTPPHPHPPAALVATHPPPDPHQPDPILPHHPAPVPHPDAIHLPDFVQQLKTFSSALLMSTKRQNSVINV